MFKYVIFLFGSSKLNFSVALRTESDVSVCAFVALSMYAYGSDKEIKERER